MKSMESEAKQISSLSSQPLKDDSPAMCPTDNQQKPQELW